MRDSNPNQNRCYRAPRARTRLEACQYRRTSQSATPTSDRASIWKVQLGLRPLGVSSTEGPIRRSVDGASVRVLGLAA